MDFEGAGSIFGSDPDDFLLKDERVGIEPDAETNWRRLIETESAVNESIRWSLQRRRQSGSMCSNSLKGTSFPFGSKGRFLKRIL